MELARRWLGSLRSGVEIGGSAFNAFPGVRAWNLDHPGNELYQRAQERLSGKTLPIDAHASADRLPLRTGCLDFLLNSHVIEHLPDTIRTLGEWDRVLKRGGIAFFIVPHQERTFDRDRARTDLRHHLADYALGITVQSDPMAPTSHYHVWKTQDFVVLLGYLRKVGFIDWEIAEIEDVDSKVGNGFTVVAQKRANATPLPPANSTRIAFHQLTLALPFQVPGRALDTIVPGSELPERIEAPRGLYRVAPIYEGFPPRAGNVFELAIGEALGPPRLESCAWEGERLVFRGKNLTPTTWLEATYPDGGVRRVLPRCERGELVLELQGLVIPEEPFPVVAVNPPPGGGKGPAFLMGLRPTERGRAESST